MKTSIDLTAKLARVWSLLDERARRLTAANEARSLGRGGIAAVSRACGLSRKAIAHGIREIAEGTTLPPGRLRRPGAGRKKITEHDPRLMDALERLIAPDTRGDPESPLRWTCKSTRALAAQLMKRVFHLDVLTCDRCGKPRRLIALLTDPPVVRAILACLGLPTEPPPLHPPRWPP